MASDVTVERFRRDDETDAVNMLVGKLPAQERQGAFDRRLARWRWQYYENPNNPDGQPLIWVARVGGVFGGMVCTIPVIVRTPNGPVPGMWGVDFIVDSSTRGKGIGRRLLEAWLKAPGIAFVRGWSPVSFKVATGVGFRLVWGFPSAKIVLSRLRYASGLVRAGRRRELIELAKVCLFTNRPPRRGSDAVSVRRDISDGALDLWAEAARAYPFAIQRDGAYLRWRFTGHPTHHYHFLSIEQGAKPAGLAILRLTDDDPPLGVISDLIVPPDSVDIGPVLFGEALAFLRSGGACAALIDLPPAASALLDGYRCALRQEFGMIIHTPDSDLEQAGIFRPDSWYQTRSDSDEDY